MSANQETARQSSIGIATGLLASCLVTILGSIAGHEPETVLFRAFIGGVIVGCVTSLLSSLISNIFGEQEDDEF